MRGILEGADGVVKATTERMVQGMTSASLARVRALAPLLCAAGLFCAACGGSTTPRPSAPAQTRTIASTTAAPQPRAGQLGYEGVPLESGSALAPASTTSAARSANGVQCAPAEQLVYHIHAHLQVYVDGQPRALPGGIGMLGAVAQQTPYGAVYGAVVCYYWLHTHTADGVIHIESPLQAIYTLGNLFAVWNQPLSAHEVAGARGPVSAFVNGQRWTKDPGAIPLIPHAAIQLDVGTPVVPFHGVSWTGTGL
jgi:hypothetical protein